MVLANEHPAKRWAREQRRVRRPKHPYEDFCKLVESLEQLAKNKGITPAISSQSFRKIIRNIVLVTLKHGPQIYTERGVLEGVLPELVHPASGTDAHAVWREGLFDELAGHSYFKTVEKDGEKAVRLVWP